jgi:hypothetical protein
MHHEKRDERAQQDIEQKQRIIDLAHQIELLKVDLAHGPMVGFVAGFRDNLSAEEQSPPELGPSRLVLDATKQAPAPQAAKQKMARGAACFR